MGDHHLMEDDALFPLNFETICFTNPHTEQKYMSYVAEKSKIRVKVVAFVLIAIAVLDLVLGATFPFHPDYRRRNGPLWWICVCICYYSAIWKFSQTQSFSAGRNAEFSVCVGIAIGSMSNLFTTKNDDDTKLDCRDTPPPDDGGSNHPQSTIVNIEIFMFMSAWWPSVLVLLIFYAQVVHYRLFKWMIGLIVAVHFARVFVVTAVHSKSMVVLYSYIVWIPLVVFIARHQELQKREMFVIQHKFKRRNEERRSSPAIIMMNSSNSRRRGTSTERALIHEHPTALERRVVERVFGRSAVKQELLPYSISFDDLELQEHIGAGAWTEVIRATYQGRVCAVKRVVRSRINESRANRILREIQLVSSLRHQNIVQFLGVSWDSVANICILFEYLPRGNLTDVLHDASLPALSWEDPKLRMALDIAQGLAYLHSRSPPILHRDVKPDNILVTTTFKCKVTDFSVSTISSGSSSSRNNSSIRRSENTSQADGGGQQDGDEILPPVVGLVPQSAAPAPSQASTVVTGVLIGTTAYMAPEAARGSPYGCPLDVYSFGITLWELHTSIRPYSDLYPPVTRPAQLLRMTCGGGVRPRVRLGMPPGLTDLMERCWREDPCQRPTMEEVVCDLRRMVGQDRVISSAPASAAAAAAAASSSSSMLSSHSFFYYASPQSFISSTSFAPLQQQAGGRGGGGGSGGLAVDDRRTATTAPVPRSVSAAATGSSGRRGSSRLEWGVPSLRWLRRGMGGGGASEASEIEEAAAPITPQQQEQQFGSVNDGSTRRSGRWGGGGGGADASTTNTAASQQSGRRGEDTSRRPVDDDAASTTTYTGTPSLNWRSFSTSSLRTTNNSGIVVVNTNNVSGGNRDVGEANHVRSPTFSMSTIVRSHSGAFPIPERDMTKEQEEEKEEKTEEEEKGVDEEEEEEKDGNEEEEHEEEKEEEAVE